MVSDEKRDNKTIKIASIVLAVMFLGFFAFTKEAEAVREFKVTVKSSGGDYTSLSAAVNGLDYTGSVNLTSLDYKTAAYTVLSGDPAGIIDGEAITWNGGASSGNIIHVTTTGKSGTTNFFLYSTQTLESGDIIDDGDGNTITVSGTPDTTQITIECYAMLDTTQVIIGGFTSNFKNKVVIQAATEAQHDGKWNEDKYRLVAGPVDNGVLRVNAGYIEIKGLQIWHNGLAGSSESSALLVKGTDNGGVYIENSILRGGRYTLRNGNSSSAGLVGRNLVVYGGSTGATVTNNHGTSRFENSVFIGGTYGVYGSQGGIQCVNCYSYGSSAAYYNFVLKANAASSDTTGSVGLQNIAYSTANFVNTTSGSEDLHLVAGSSLIDAGFSPSSAIGLSVQVSSIRNSIFNMVRGAIVTLTNGSNIAKIQLRNFIAHTWLSPLEYEYEMRYAYTGATTKIAIVSDAHIGSDANAVPNFTAAIDDIDDSITGVSKVFVLGDISHNGASAEYDDYVSTRATSDIAVANWHELVGNHDSVPLFGTKLGISPTYYSVTVGNMVFVLLSDTNNTLSAGALAFLNTTLQNNQDKNIVLMSHQGRYASTPMTVSAADFLGPNNTIESYLAVNDFDMWFAGHVHGYEYGGSPNITYYYKADSVYYGIDGNARSGSFDIGMDEYVPPPKTISSFDFNGLSPAVIGTVDGSGHTVSLTVPYGTDVTALVPTIVIAGSSVSPNTGVAQDFTSPVTYTVTASDSSTQDYIVTVTTASGYTVGGTLSGLSGALTLQNNSGDDLIITDNGPFTFNTALGNGSDYEITILAQPSGQTCSVTDGTGSISSSNVTAALVSCSNNPATVTQNTSGTGTRNRPGTSRFAQFNSIQAPSVPAPSFTRPMRHFENNVEVKKLQVFLNSFPDTKLANTGPGSPGSETYFFGTLTKKAVIKFQEKYAEEILIPLGLKDGTGFVGEATIKKINELVNTATY